MLIPSKSLRVHLAHNTPISLPDSEKVTGRQNEISMGDERQFAIFESKKWAEGYRTL